MRQEAAKAASSQTGLKWLGGITLGALTMYLADPDRGKRRRALARDKIRSVAGHTGDVVDVALRDAGNRIQGLLAETSRMLFRRNHAVNDRVLAERVRARIGRAISHPHPVKVSAQQGRITLSGPILSREKEQLIHAVTSVPGVADIEDLLETHQNQNGLPSLQGEGRHPRYTVLQRNWSPALRATALLGGGAIGYYGLSRRMPANLLLGTIGLSLITRAVTNRPLLHIDTVHSSMQAIDLHKDIYIEAAPDTVFDRWSNYENFPRFMSNVLDVRNLGNGRSHWVVSGPAGNRIEWDAVLTESVRPWVLAWKSEPGALVEHTGAIYLEPADTGTRVRVEVAYNPPVGALGHVVVSLFNGNPERQLEDDLLRMKAFIESGVTSDHVAPPVQAGQTLH